MERIHRVVKCSKDQKIEILKNDISAADNHTLRTRHQVLKSDRLLRRYKHLCRPWNFIYLTIPSESWAQYDPGGWHNKSLKRQKARWVCMNISLSLDCQNVVSLIRILANMIVFEMECVVHFPLERLISALLWPWFTYGAPLHFSLVQRFLFWYWCTWKLLTAISIRYLLDNSHFESDFLS